LPGIFVPEAKSKAATEAGRYYDTKILGGILIQKYAGKCH